jgi:hypothetical protein
MVDQAVLLEVKSGPFNPLVAKEFAIWAPEECSDQGQEYLSDLKRRCVVRLP